MSLVRDLQELFEFFKRRAARGRGCFSRYLIRNVCLRGIGALGWRKTSINKRRLRNLVYQAAPEKPNDLIYTTDDFDCYSCSSQSQSDFLQSFSVKTQKTLKSCIVPAQLAF